MTDGSSNPEGFTPPPAKEAVEQVDNPLKELHTAFEGVAQRIDQKLTQRPGDLWLYTDKKYRLPHVSKDLQRFEDDIRAGFPDKTQRTFQGTDYDTDTPKEIRWTESRKSGAILDVDPQGQVEGVNQYHVGSSFENDDTEYIAQELGALKPGETIADLKNDPSRWKVYEAPQGIRFPGQAILPTKVEGVSLFLNEMPTGDGTNVRRDVIQIDVRMNKQAIDAVRKAPLAAPAKPIAA